MFSIIAVGVMKVKLNFPTGLYYSQQDPYPKKPPVSLVEDLSGKLSFNWHQ